MLAMIVGKEDSPVVQFGLTRRAAYFGIALSFLAMAAQPSIAQQQKGKETEKPKYQKVVPKAAKWSELSKDISHSELTEPPRDFPIPVYSGRFSYGYSRTSGVGSTTSLQISSTDNIESILSWYRSGLKAAGWQLQEGMPGGQGVGNITGYKTGMLCRVELRTTGKGTEIHLSVSKKI